MQCGDLNEKTAGYWMRAKAVAMINETRCLSRRDMVPCCLHKQLHKGSSHNGCPPRGRIISCLERGGAVVSSAV